jgi:NADPH:quinone reductase-like Zn-dependent oxidoreductase
MRAHVVPQGCTAIEGLAPVRRPAPAPGPGQVRIRVRAASLNYRDQAVVTGNYYAGPVAYDTIPLSDGAGEVVELGPGVSGVAIGDRVAGCFSQVPPDGPPAGSPRALGSPLDGMLAEEVVLYADGVVPIPEFHSFEAAACLPCAGVTAWHGLMAAGRPVGPGDTVLVLGTGGVSIFALQFARAAGAEVIATTSSDAKAERLKSLGAAAVINYRTHPEWHEEVLRLTGGRGVDCVVEVGGSGTLDRSFKSLARGGKVALIGVLTGHDAAPDPHLLMLKGGHLHGILVGDRQLFLDMLAAIRVNRLVPLVDRVFPFDEAQAAYRHQASGGFMGKVVVSLG